MSNNLRDILQSEIKTNGVTVIETAAFSHQRSGWAFNWRLADCDCAVGNVKSLIATASERADHWDVDFDPHAAQELISKTRGHGVVHSGVTADESRETGCLDVSSWSYRQFSGVRLGLPSLSRWESDGGRVIWTISVSKFSPQIRHDQDHRYALVDSITREYNMIIAAEMAVLMAERMPELSNDEVIVPSDKKPTLA